MRLKINSISFLVCGRPLVDPCGLGGRKFRAQLQGDFLRQRALDGEDVGQISIILLRPQVPVMNCVNQLHNQTDAVAGTADTALHQRGNAQLLGNFADIVRFASIRHD